MKTNTAGHTIPRCCPATTFHGRSSLREIFAAAKSTDVELFFMKGVFASPNNAPITFDVPAVMFLDIYKKTK
jgi:hypothetical protein